MRPRQAYSWRKYQADKQNNNTTCKDKPGFPTTFRELIRPLFMDLSNDELHSVHWGINHLPLKNTTPSFLPPPPPPPKSENFPSLPF